PRVRRSRGGFRQPGRRGGEARRGENSLLHRGGAGESHARARRALCEQGSGRQGARAAEGPGPRARRRHPERMTWLDYAVFGVLALSTAWGAWRGLARDVISVAGWLIALLPA